MNKSLLLSSLLMGLLMLVACEEEPVYNQLTQDPLRHLYSVVDDFGHNGEPVECAGAVRFLLDGVEIVERTGGLLVPLLVGFTVVMLLVVGEYRTVVLSLFVVCAVTNGTKKYNHTQKFTIY